MTKLRRQGPFIPAWVGSKSDESLGMVISQLAGKVKAGASLGIRVLVSKASSSTNTIIETDKVLLVTVYALLMIPPMFFIASVSIAY